LKSQIWSHGSSKIADNARRRIEKATMIREKKTVKVHSNDNNLEKQRREDEGGFKAVYFFLATEPLS
jgi:hypothetical protein